MPTPLAAILNGLSQIAKENQRSEPICPACGERHVFIRHGHYKRYLFDDSDQVRIQRYLCLNSQCRRRTFSILPHPFLPVIRHSLCFILLLLEKVETDKLPIASLARSSCKSWPVIRRAVRRAEQVREWLIAEGKVSIWGPSPCLAPAMSWTAFTRSLSWAFYPARFLNMPPTQNENV